MAKKQKGLQYYFKKVEDAHQKFEEDLLASGQYVYVGVQNGQKVYIDKVTGHMLRILRLEPFSRLI